tara:strand:+ start:107 stop:1345 length:1239 start_codon:yes stop_codon:yes gene_type:complete
MSKKLIIKWTKPPPEELAKKGITLELFNLNVIWHADEDVEVTEFFQFPDPKAKTILGKYSQAKRVVRGNPNEVYAQIYKHISDKATFQKKWDAAKHLYLTRTPFSRAASEAFLHYVNNYGMTPKKFAEKTGVENSVLFRELKGQRQLSLEKAIKYSKALACDPVDLLFDKQMCRLWGSVDLFNMHNAGNEDYWIGQIKAAPILKDSKNEGGLLGDQLIPVPRDIYRPEIKAILIDSLGSYLHNHFVYYYRTDNSDAINENKLVIVGREIPELEDLGMDTMQYFFGILKIEKGKQQIINPEPTAEKRLIATGPFSFIAPVVSMVKRGAMKKDHSYFESIEQAEQIKEAEQKILETQTRAMEALQKQLEKLDYDMKQIQKLTEKERAVLKEKLGMEKLFKSIDNIPNFIRKKVG